MNIDEKLALVREVAPEILVEDELKALFAEKEHPLAYDGFEPSGRIHIAQGLLRAITVNKLAATGIRYIFWVADWFALMNNKLGGDLEKIKVTGEYFIEVWKASGMRQDVVEFRWASEAMDSEYWERTIRIAMSASVDRIKRCAQIMGRSEGETLSGAQIFYPCMQASDIFELGVDIAQLGMDQRKVNVFAREAAEKLGLRKPIAIHHHMLLGLQHVEAEGLTGADKAIAKKMSKSNPDSAIFMTDSADEVKRKFKKAYCPEGIAEDNPVLEYCKYIVFERHWLGRETTTSTPRPSLTIERPEKFGGNVTFENYEALEAAFVAKEVHPMDLKNAVAKVVNELLAPVNEHFTTDAHAKQLAQQVASYAVTR